MSREIFFTDTKMFTVSKLPTDEEFKRLCDGPQEWGEAVKCAEWAQTNIERVDTNITLLINSHEKQLRALLSNREYWVQIGRAARIRAERSKEKA